MTREWFMPTGTAGSTANPGNKEYPGVPYRPTDFHNTCSIEDINNPDEVRDCELTELRDLDQVYSNIKYLINIILF